MWPGVCIPPPIEGGDRKKSPPPTPSPMGGECCPPPSDGGRKFCPPPSDGGGCQKILPPFVGGDKNFRSSPPHLDRFSPHLSTFPPQMRGEIQKISSPPHLARNSTPPRHKGVRWSIQFSGSNERIFDLIAKNRDFSFLKQHDSIEKSPNWTKKKQLFWKCWHFADFWQLLPHVLGEDNKNQKNQKTIPHLI